MPRRARPVTIPAFAPRAPARAPGGEAIGRLPLIALLVVVAVSQALAVSGLRSLPSAPFGGDLYYQMGCVRSIAASLDPLASCSTSGALPGYLPLYGTLVAALSLITRLDAFPAMMVAAVLFAVLSVWLVWFVSARLFDSRTGLLVASLWYLAHPGLIARYTDFAAGIVAPLLYWALARYRLDRGARSAARLGLVLAIAGYTHAVLFVGGAFLAAAMMAWGLLSGRDERAWRAHLAAESGRAALVAALALLALGYWWKPIVVHHGRTSPYYTEWNGGPSLVTGSDRLDYTRSLLVRAVDPRTPVEPLVTALALAGAAVVIRRRARPAYATVGALAGLTLLWSLHFFVTEPLLGTHFVPEYVVPLLWGCARFLLVAALLAAALERWRARGSVATRALAFGSIAIAAAGGVAAVTQPSLERGRAPLHPLYQDLQDFVERNTKSNDVFLSTNELSFVLSALTGRKVLTTRRAQNDAFLDMDARNQDAALILYGRDPELRKRLLGRYRVGYLLWTDEWPSTEFYIDEGGRVTDYDDPLMWFENAARDSAAARAGVRTVHREGWVDPTLRGDRYRRFPLTIVTPDNYARPDRPWHPDLDHALERVWSYEEGGRPIAIVFRVRETP